ncbi:MAG TPA: hypothetical protein VFA94_14095 [Acidimicrobiales bacterium]|nr:hypothetical protein [Acidimicrobiales bacterium]
MRTIVAGLVVAVALLGACGSSSNKPVNVKSQPTPTTATTMGSNGYGP